jgi:hypothetical protein
MSQKRHNRSCSHASIPALKGLLINQIEIPFKGEQQCRRPELGHPGLSAFPWQLFAAKRPCSMQKICSGRHPNSVGRPA